MKTFYVRYFNFDTKQEIKQVEIKSNTKGQAFTKAVKLHINECKQKGIEYIPCSCIITEVL